MLNEVLLIESIYSDREVKVITKSPNQYPDKNFDGMLGHKQ